MGITPEDGEGRTTIKMAQVDLRYVGISRAMPILLLWSRWEMKRRKYVGCEPSRWTHANSICRRLSRLLIPRSNLQLRIITRKPHKITESWAGGRRSLRHKTI